jgi:hypothetical protein
MPLQGERQVAAPVTWWAFNLELVGCACVQKRFRASPVTPEGLPYHWVAHKSKIEQPLVVFQPQKVKR